MTTHETIQDALTLISEAWRSPQATQYRETALRASANRLSAAVLSPECGPLRGLAARVAVMADSLAESARSAREGDFDDAARCVDVALYWHRAAGEELARLESAIV